MAPDAAAPGGPPPSTLAAQLVGNISTTARSSRPDENSELKRFFETIERIKNDPDSLKTADDRVEHNHLLIYVYACVVLESLKWDDPFVNREQLQSEVLKAVQFLKVTIQETPTVLSYTVNGGFLRRGPEPLWVWLLPKVLKMLGHPQCLSLSSSLESFFDFILSASRSSGSLLNPCDAIYGYLQADFRCKRQMLVASTGERLKFHTAILNHLRSTLPESQGPKAVKLPDQNLLNLLYSQQPEEAKHGCFFNLSDRDHALRHAQSMFNILHAAVLSHKQGSQQIVHFDQHLPWLIDSLGALNEELKRRKEYYEYAPVFLLEKALNLIQCSSGIDQVVSHKLDGILVLLATDVIEQPKAILGLAPDGKTFVKTLALTLVHLADASVKKKPISKIVAAQLLKPLGRFSADGHCDNYEDLRVSVS